MRYLKRFHEREHVIWLEHGEFFVSALVYNTQIFEIFNERTMTVAFFGCSPRKVISNGGGHPLVCTALCVNANLDFYFLFGYSIGFCTVHKYDKFQRFDIFRILRIMSREQDGYLLVTVHFFQISGRHGMTRISDLILRTQNIHWPQGDFHLQDDSPSQNLQLIPKS